MQTRNAEASAESILTELDLRAAPIDLEVIARHLQVQIYKESLEAEVSGVLLCESGKRKIAVNSKHHKNRQRFTIAHELGHVKLHVDDKDRVFVDHRFYRNEKSSEGVDSEEIEANAFAASLLMPKDLIEDALSTVSAITDSDIFRMSVRFGVSEQAMTLRLVKLHYIAPD